MSIDFRAQWRGNEQCEVIISTIGREESPVLNVSKNAQVCGYQAHDLANMGRGQITSEGLKPQKTAEVINFEPR